MPEEHNGKALEITGLNHYFGTGELRNQILFGIDLTIEPGELVIMTGPSGCGKTTLLTLIGSLRHVQEGSLRVLGATGRPERRGACRGQAQHRLHFPDA